MAVGYNDQDDTIWMMGGDPNRKQLTSFDGVEFVDNGTNGISNDVYGFGQFYNQI